MGRAKKVRKFAAVKRVIGKKDARLRENQIKQLSEIKKKPTKGEDVVRAVYVLEIFTLSFKSNTDTLSAPKSLQISSSNTTKLFGLPIKFSLIPTS